MTNPDNTALARQHRRIQRLREVGVTRTTVLVHEECRQGLDALRPYLLNPEQALVLEGLTHELINQTKPTNVAQVRQLSPFRYPGGKTWLIPELRRWLVSLGRPISAFVEPFAGGAMSALTVAAENLADRVVIAELDEEVAAVWDLIFNGTNDDVNWLCRQIRIFDVSLSNVREIIDHESGNRREAAFRTIIKNRMQRGGILAPGAGLVNGGENGKGLLSRWYAETLVKRIESIRLLHRRVAFIHGDAFEVIEAHAQDRQAAFFIDPPYTVGGKKAGKRLYTHCELDHERLFHVIAGVNGSVLMTYDDTSEVNNLAQLHGLSVAKVPMKSTHHAIHYELLITKV